MNVTIRSNRTNSVRENFAVIGGIINMMLLCLLCCLLSCLLC